MSDTPGPQPRNIDIDSKKSTERKEKEEPKPKGRQFTSNVEQDIDLPIADRLLEFPDRFERRDVQTADLAFGPVKTRELLAGRGVERVDEIVLECVSVSVGRDGTVNVTKVAQKGGGAEFKSAS